MTAEPAEGSITPEELVPDEETPVESEESTKTNKELATEVIAGYWGRGNDRKRRLEAAGHDYAAVSEEISKIYHQ
jgi:hypothetical protein